MVHELPGTMFSSTADRGGYDSTARAALTMRELQRYDEASGGWVRPPGEFTVRIGRSSADPRLPARVRSG